MFYSCHHTVDVKNGNKISNMRIVKQFNTLEATTFGIVTVPKVVIFYQYQ